MTTKICAMCKEEKPVEEFAKTTKNGQPYVRGKCRPCFNIYYREWYQNNKEAHKARVYANRNQSSSSRRAQRYKLSEEEYQELLQSNDGLCHLCNEKPATAIDHCHTTNVVRGVLCFGCNTGLGKLGDDIEGLMQAVRYLTNPIWNKTKE